MSESVSHNFNHLKIHTQYSICEGAARIDDLQEYSKKNKIKCLSLILKISIILKFTLNTRFVKEQLELMICKNILRKIK